GLSLPGWIGGLGGMIRGWAGSWLKGQLFDSGGILGHGGMAVNLSGKPERILTPEHTKKLDRFLDGPSGGVGVVDLSPRSVQEVATAILAGSRNVSVRTVDDREYMTAGASRYPSPLAVVPPCSSLLRRSSMTIRRAYAWMSMRRALSAL